jgi:plastocyanin
MTATNNPAAASTERAAGPERAWVRVLVWASAVAAAADLAAPALSGEVIPPLAAGAVVTLVSLLLLRRFPRTCIGVLGVTNLLLAVSSAPFAAPALAHPDSPVAFTHSMIHLVGHLLAVAAAVAAWRRASPAGARWTGLAAAGLLAVTVVVGMASAALTTSQTAQAGDVPVAVRGFAFPAEVRVPSGGTLFIDNADVLRHTFSVEGIDLAQELPERSSARLEVNLDPGTYQVICEVPGHESMTGTLIVE